MAANIDTMLYVGEVPWHGLGHQYLEPPKTSEEIIQGASLGWEVADEKMITSLHEVVPNYKAIYRTDNNAILGVVNKAVCNHVQNTSTFNAFEDLLGSSVEVETAASLGIGQTVFGCFKIAEKYKVLDDEVDHYFVVVNDHLKCDGKITILNTPVRVVCNNTLNAALNNNSAKIRVPVSEDNYVNLEIARKIIGSAGDSIDQLQVRANDLVMQKVDQRYTDALLDELFPFIEIKDGFDSMHTKANDKIDMMRTTFLHDCMGADNLQNYRGTKWQILMAVTDFAQHYYTNSDKSYDLSYRMGSVGLGSVDSTQPIGLTSKYLKIANKLAA